MDVIHLPLSISPLLSGEVRRSVEQGPHVVDGDATAKAHISTRILRRRIPLRGRIHRQADGILLRPPRAQGVRERASRNMVYEPRSPGVRPLARHIAPNGSHDNTLSPASRSARTRS